MKTLTKIMFYIPKKFLIKFIFFLFLLLGFNIYVNAETINNVCSSINQACSTNNRFTYSLYGGPEDTYSTGTFKSTYSGKADYLVFSFDYDLLKDTSYSLSISAVSTDFRNISKSNTFLEYATDCATTTGNIEITNLSFSKSKIVISFKTTQNIPYFILSFGDPEGSAITGVSTFGISSIDITTIESNDTQNIIDNQNQNANAIIDNQQQNTQDIIDNNNQNTEDLKDTINENFNSCRPSKNLFPGWLIGTGINSTNGAIVPNDTGAISTDFIVVDFDTNPYYTLSGLTTNLRTFVAAYNSNKEFIGRTGANYAGLITFDSSSFSSGSPSASGEVAYIRITSYNPREGTTIDTNINSIKTMLNVGSSPLSYEEFGKDICSNKLDDTNDKLDNINGTLTDGTPPDTENFLDHLNDLFNDGPISTLILMPLNLINHYVDGFNSTCSPINLGSLYGTDLSLPCINLESKLGSTLWTTIDGLVSIFMIYNICMLFVSVFNDITSLRDTFDSLYVPQHAKTLGKHTSEVE